MGSNPLVNPKGAVNEVVKVLREVMRGKFILHIFCKAQVEGLEEFRSVESAPSGKGAEVNSVVGN